MKRPCVRSFLMAGLFLLGGGGVTWAEIKDPDFLTAQAQDKAGDRKGAIASYTKVIDHHPQLAVAYLDRAHDERKTGDLDSAIADYSRCIELGPPDEDVYALRAYTKSLKGDEDGAMADADKSLSLSRSSFAYEVRSHARRVKGDLHGAIDDMASAIDLEPSLGNYNNRGLCEEDAGRNEEALADFRKSAVMTDSEYPHLRIWVVRSRLGERDAANTELQAYLNKREPKPDDWFAQVGSFLVGRLDEKGLINAGINSDPSKRLGRQCEAYFYAGCVRLLNKQDASDCFKKCVQTNEVDYDEYQSAVAELRNLIPAK